MGVPVSFYVTWEIDIDDATNHVDAARKALEHIQREGSIAHVFSVLESSRPDIETVTVDLDAIDGVPDAPPVGYYGPVPGLTDDDGQPLPDIDREED